MAINVDTVYKTVLLIINKEQRGYLTPNEFNKIATKVQLDIINEYFETINQQSRVFQNETEYGNRYKTVQENLDAFKTIGDCTYNAGSTPPSFTLPTSPTFYKLGTVIYDNNIEAEVVQRHELAKLNLSTLTKPSKRFPVYINENNKLILYPQTITSDVQVTYVKKPADVVWNFTSANGYYEYDSVGSVNFELDIVEQNNVIVRTLLHAGIVIKDPTIIEMASREVAQESQNQKV